MDLAGESYNETQAHAQVGSGGSCGRKEGVALCGLGLRLAVYWWHMSRTRPGLFLPHCKTAHARASPEEPGSLQLLACAYGHRAAAPAILTHPKVWRAARRRAPRQRVGCSSPPTMTHTPSPARAPLAPRSSGRRGWGFGGRLGCLCMQRRLLNTEYGQSARSDEGSGGAGVPGIPAPSFLRIPLHSTNCTPSQNPHSRRNNPSEWPMWASLTTIANYPPAPGPSAAPGPAGRHLCCMMIQSKKFKNIHPPTSI